MKAFCVRICLTLIPVLGLGVFADESFGAGPAATQQAITQVETSLTEASIGWRGGWGHRGGWGYGGWGYGRGWGGYYGRGWGGYYGGYGYARPWIYRYPSYGYGYGYRGYYRPYYYSGYSYASPYQCCGSYGYSNCYQPISCCSSYSYPSYYGASVYSTPTVYTSQVVTTPSYSPSVVYSSPSVVYSSPSVVSGTTTYGTPVYSPGTSYSPTYSTSTVISRPTPVQSTTPTTTSPAAVPAPYPAPPAEINQQPSTRRPPMATRFLSVQSGYHVPRPPMPMPTASSSPVYSPIVAYTGVTRHAAYSPATFNYSPLGQPVRLVSSQAVY